MNKTNLKIVAECYEKLEAVNATCDEIASQLLEIHSELYEQLVKMSEKGQAGEKGEALTAEMDNLQSAADACGDITIDALESLAAIEGVT